MKRDWEVIRMILRHVEDLPLGHYLTPFGDTREQAGIVEHHIHLLLQAGWINGEKGSIPSGTRARTLTEKGCDMAALMLDDMRWSHMNDIAREMGLPILGEYIPYLAQKAGERM